MKQNTSTLNLIFLGETPPPYSCQVHECKTLPNCSCPRALWRRVLHSVLMCHAEIRQHHTYTLLLAGKLHTSNRRTIHSTGKKGASMNCTTTAVCLCSCYSLHAALHCVCMLHCIARFTCGRVFMPMLRRCHYVLTANSGANHLAMSYDNHPQT